ncbi:D-ribose ABC transporter substrate-binding protein [Spirochaetia bacterium]|nr:D-ribose ABC transporter substrate-binding protein [Spirochaetia bacterium]
MKKSISIVLAVVVLLLAACNGSKSNSGAAARTESGNQPKTIGFLVPTVRLEFWIGLADGYVKQMKAAGYNVISTSYEGDAAKTVECVENFIAQKVDVIVACVADSSADEVFKQAMDAGIPVFAFGNAPKNYSYLTVADNADVGLKIAEMAADFVNEKHGGKTQIAVITSLTNPDMANRSEALLSNLRRLLPGSEIVMTVNTYDTVGDGTAFTENLLQKYPDCKIVCSYGDAMGVEAMEVYKAAGKAGSDVAIFGCDATRQSLLSIKNGDIFRGTISMGDLSEVLGNFTQDIFKGSLEKGTIYIKNTKVTPANIGQYLN